MKRPNWEAWITNKQECRQWLRNYIKKEILAKGPDESRLHLRKSSHNLILKDHDSVRFPENAAKTLL